MSFPDTSKALTPSRAAPAPVAAPEPSTEAVVAAPAFRLPPILTAGPTVGGLWRAFCRRWVLALAGSLLLGAAFGAALWFAFPAKYSAEVSINVNRPPREFN